MIIKQVSENTVCPKCNKTIVLNKKRYATKLDERRNEEIECPYCKEQISIHLTGDEDIVSVTKSAD